MTSIIEAKGIAKRFGKVEALGGIDLAAEHGRVLALLGPNGAGKTTFVRCVATLLRADSGSLQVCGFDAFSQPDEVRQSIGLAGQYAAVEGAMTGRENLVMVARLFGQDRRNAAKNADRVLEQLDLTEAGNRLVRTYSGGMRRRLDLGASLVGTPRLLLLDEPTTGLDPRSRTDLWGAIRNLVLSGTDVLLTTQYLEEADQLASDVVIIDHGQVIAAGTPSELKQRAGRDVIEARVHTDTDLDAVVRILGEVGAGEPIVDPTSQRVTVTVEHGAPELMAGLRSLEEAGISLDDIGLRRPTLDEVFLSLTGRPVEETAEAAR
jgi:ABC-2 type transport system ATP-binding protein